MKIAIKTRATLITFLLIASASPDWAADSRPQLMARMDFSKAPISQDVEVQIVTAKTLETLAPKSDSVTGATTTCDDEETNKLITSRTAQCQAESLAVEAEESAAAAKAKQAKAEARYAAAKRGILYNPTVTAENLGQALDIRTTCQRAAEAARDEAREKTLRARRLREAVNKIIADAQAEECRLEKERSAQVANNEAR